MEWCRSVICIFALHIAINNNIVCYRFRQSPEIDRDLQSDRDQMLIEASPTDGGTEPDRSDLIHGRNLLLDRPVQFYLDCAISNDVYLLLCVA